MALTSLNHHLDAEWLETAYDLTRKDGAPGIDGQTASEYEKHREEHLTDLLRRLKAGCYKAPAVRRAYIPKADGSKRPLGIATFENKVAQRAIAMLLEPIYEQDFKPFWYGFRPGRSAHGALGDLRSAIMEQGLRWVVDVDLRKYFDTIDHGHLRSFPLLSKNGIRKVGPPDGRDNHDRVCCGTSEGYRDGTEHQAVRSTSRRTVPR